MKDFYERRVEVTKDKLALVKRGCEQFLKDAEEDIKNGITRLQDIVEGIASIYNAVTDAELDVKRAEDDLERIVQIRAENDLEPIKEGN